MLQVDLLKFISLTRLDTYFPDPSDAVWTGILNGSEMVETTYRELKRVSNIGTESIVKTCEALRDLISWV